MSLKDPYEIIAIAETKDTARHRKKALGVSLLSSALTLALCLGVFFLRQQRLEDALSRTVLLSSADSKGSFRLPDGSTVWLNRNSRLTFDGEFGDRSRTVLLEGEGYFDVAKDHSRPFVVQAKNLSVKVFGTRFTVTSYPDRAESVCLEEGSVCADLPGEGQVMLSPGQMLVLTEDGGLDSIERVNAWDHTCWIDSRLVFRDMPLSDIALALEHWFGLRITFSDAEEAEDILLSMTVKPGDSPDDILPLVATLSHARYSRPADGTVHYILK